MPRWRCSGRIFGHPSDSACPRYSIRSSSCLLACPIIHGHIYYDECVIHTVWAGCFGTLAMNIYTKIWFNEVSCSRGVPLSGVESCCWPFQAWLSCHVLILTFTLALSMNAIADSNDQSSRIRQFPVDIPISLCEFLPPPSNPTSHCLMNPNYSLCSFWIHLEDKKLYSPWRTDPCSYLHHVSFIMHCDLLLICNTGFMIPLA